MPLKINSSCLWTHQQINRLGLFLLIDGRWCPAAVNWSHVLIAGDFSGVPGVTSSAGLCTFRAELPAVGRPSGLLSASRFFFVGGVDVDVDSLSCSSAGLLVLRGRSDGVRPRISATLSISLRFFSAASCSLRSVEICVMTSSCSRLIFCRRGSLWPSFSRRFFLSSSPGNTRHVRTSRTTES